MRVLWGLKGWCGDVVLGVEGVIGVNGMVGVEGWCWLMGWWGLRVVVI